MKESTFFKGTLIMSVILNIIFIAALCYNQAKYEDCVPKSDYDNAYETACVLAACIQEHIDFSKEYMYGECEGQICSFLKNIDIMPQYTITSIDWDKYRK